MATSIYNNQHPLTAPHQATPDAEPNPSFRDGKHKAQHPVGELASRNRLAAGASAAPFVLNDVTTFGRFGK